MDTGRVDAVGLTVCLVDSCLFEQDIRSELGDLTGLSGDKTIKFHALIDIRRHGILFHGTCVMEIGMFTDLAGSARGFHELPA